MMGEVQVFEMWESGDALVELNLSNVFVRLSG
jgi:hypothetical protein